MIIWNGYGILVPIISFGSLLLMEILVESLMHDNQFYQEHNWPMAAGFIMACFLLLLLSKIRSGHKHQTQNDRVIDDDHISHPPDSFFFIPLRFWPYILLVIGIISLNK